jgi:hypothetical protein
MNARPRRHSLRRVESRYIKTVGAWFQAPDRGFLPSLKMEPDGK